MMVARIWRATATAEGARRYHEHFVTSVQPVLERTPGFAGATLLEREGEAGTEIQVTTHWESIHAIRDFAGPDVSVAVVEPAAKEALLRYDTEVAHYTITATVSSD
ncbi:antibiotic biosynthesis monooxygenase [Actinomycetes bacterium KLBMP 9759]